MLCYNQYAYNKKKNLKKKEIEHDQHNALSDECCTISTFTITKFGIS